MLIQLKKGIPPNEQILMDLGNQLKNERKLFDYCSDDIGFTLYLSLNLREGGHTPIGYINDNELDPLYNYNFTNINDLGKTFMQGGIHYKKCYALKVTGKYDNVSYHGTAECNAKEGYDLSKGKQFVYEK
ncbi:4742_t:CDS:2, partial [Dentiscutata erythropus]